MNCKICGANFLNASYSNTYGNKRIRGDLTYKPGICPNAKNHKKLVKSRKVVVDGEHDGIKSFHELEVSLRSAINRLRAKNNSTARPYMSRRYKKKE